MFSFEKKSNMGLKDKYPNRVHYIISGTYTTLRAKLVYPIKLFLNCWISLFLMIKLRPDFVVTTGSFSFIIILINPSIHVSDHAQGK